jgi:AraC-like DNA-binding protein
MVSNSEKIRLSWLKFMLIGSFVIFFSLIIVVLNQYFRWEKSMPVGFLYLYIGLLLIFITVTLFKSLKQPEIYSGIGTDEAKTTPRYAAFTMTKEDSKKIREDLEQFMEEKKPYLDPDLSLKGLAQDLNLNDRDLSKVINNNIGLRFFDYVNKYRIQDATSLIENPPDPKMTILEIMYDVGFNSKSSFNTAFRKFTGITPSEFKNRTRN